MRAIVRVLSYRLQASVDAGSGVWVVLVSKQINFISTSIIIKDLPTFNKHNGHDQVESFSTLKKFILWYPETTRVLSAILT